MKRAKSVETYIHEANDWRDELIALREILRATGLDEEIKWGAPCYTAHGKNIVSLMAFKNYVGLWFHQGALLKDDRKVLINAQEGKTKGLRQWRMQSAKDIKPRIIKQYIKEAIANARAGQEISPARNKKLLIPVELKDVLRKSKSLAATFKRLSPGKQREYANYVAEAKRDSTRIDRARKAVPAIRAGRGLHDKYRT